MSCWGPGSARISTSSWQRSLSLGLLWALAMCLGCGMWGSTAPETAADAAVVDGQGADEPSGANSSETIEGERGSATLSDATPANSSSTTGTLTVGTLSTGSGGRSLGNGVGQGPAAASGREPRPLMLGSFNIQRFGESKSAKPVVMDRLMELVYPFDVLAIQEVVSQKEAVIQRFVESLNQKYDAQFNYVIGPFVGRTTYVERFAYIYDSRRIKVMEQPFIVADPDDKFHREPLVVRFQVREELSSTPFSFVMVNVHLDPKEAAAELDHLAEVISRLESLYAGQEDDLLVLGDFNLSPGKIFSETKFATRVSWKPIFDDRVMTNTRQTQAYDNILLSTDRTTEFLERQGVIDLRQRFQISLEEALEISDHLPIWAAFSLHESSADRVAQEPNPAVR